MKILIIDNYDSFTFNLYQYVGEILQIRGQVVCIDVIRNDKITVEQIKKRRYERIIISPGPGDPSDRKYFGVCADVLTKVGQTTPVLGVCLGMQGMAHYFGGRIIKAAVPMHGKTSVIVHDGQGVFAGMPQQLSVMRYHSLVADPTTLPECLHITAVVGAIHDLPAQAGSPLQRDVTKEAEIMGLRHRRYPIEGIQFHPESFATEGGKMMLINFLFPVKK